MRNVPNSGDFDENCLVSIEDDISSSVADTTRAHHRSKSDGDPYPVDDKARRPRAPSMSSELQAFPSLNDLHLAPFVGTGDSVRGPQVQ